MRYVSGLILLVLSCVVFMASLQDPWLTQVIASLLAVALALQGVFAFLPSELAAPAQGSNRRRKLWAAGIITHALWGALLLIVALQQIFMFGDIVGALTLALLFAAPVLGGSIHLYKIYRKAGLTTTASPPALDDLGAQKTQIIQIAARKNGECTLLELVAHSGINIERVEQLLDSLYGDDLVSVHVDEEGQTFYRFAQLVDASKARRDILDEARVLFDHDPVAQECEAQAPHHVSKR